MPDPMEAAKAQVALKYDPQESAIQRQIQMIKDQTASNEVGINAFGATGRTGTNTAFDTLNSLLTANRQQSASDLSRQVQAVGQGYDVARDYQNAVANEGRDRLSQYSNAMGAGPAGNLQVQTQLEGTLANLLGQYATGKAGAMGNLQDWSGRWDQILGQGINIGEQTRAVKLSDLEREIVNMIGSNKVAGLEGVNSQYGRLSDIIGARGNDLMSTYNQLAQQEWENSYRQAQLNQAASEANARMAAAADELAFKYYAQNSDNAARSAAASREGQLTTKDLIQLAMGQQEMESGSAQQKFENSLASQRLALDSRRDYQDPYAEGNSMIAKALTSGAFMDLAPEEQGQWLSGYGDQLAGLGYLNSIYDDHERSDAMYNAVGSIVSGWKSPYSYGSSGGGGGSGFNWASIASPLVSPAMSIARWLS